MNDKSTWNIYRTRFLVRARQLTEPLAFIDSFGREHSGQSGDYVVETCGGIRRITSRALFEDIYVPLAPEPIAPSTTSVQKPPVSVGLARSATPRSDEDRARVPA